jgi:hypothetical protein
MIEKKQKRIRPIQRPSGVRDWLSRNGGKGKREKGKGKTEARQSMHIMSGTSKCFKTEQE